ncbi:MAG: tetraacyldisaccharide 4'-kinase [Pseudomonadota bacterium]
MTDPWFWHDTGPSARLARTLLMPASVIYDLAQQIRSTLAKPYVCEAPVICIGNATLGGVGKTPFAIALYKILSNVVDDIAFVTRGYRGTAKGPTFVDTSQSAVETGDEPLLLAKVAKTIVAKERAAGVKFAVDHGAKLILMDDGFQNPTVQKDISILLQPSVKLRVDAVFPAGPYREPLARAINRADIIIKINSDATVVPATNDTLVEKPNGDFLAFCGIGHPERFAHSLKKAGFSVLEFVPFADHHIFSKGELESLRQRALQKGAQLITTEKDFVRLDAADRIDIEVFRIAMHIENPDALIGQIQSLLDQRRPGWRSHA